MSPSASGALAMISRILEALLCHLEGMSLILAVVFEKLWIDRTISGLDSVLSDERMDAGAFLLRFFCSVR